MEHNLRVATLARRRTQKRLDGRDAERRRHPRGHDSATEHAGHLPLARTRTATLQSASRCAHLHAGQQMTVNDENVQCVILAGGLATRMQPLALTVPKTLL